ncbi:unnamed protein product [Paramecium primaurelia]|uniref:Uncharacterized protein n=1 Tax=Paramecium primaurelia TaxID=5886 RepID=A0A8S1MCD0_PARPR|nr:unnamed protein product [Paramecium primaurelia]
MKQQKWEYFLEELGESKYEELNEKHLKSIVKLPKEKMTFLELQHYLSNDFQVLFNEDSTRSKWHKKDQYLLIWCVVKLTEKRNIQYNESLQEGVFEYLSTFLGLSADFLLEKWMSLLKQSLKEMPWKQEEDEILIELRNQYPNKGWTYIAKEFNRKTKNIRYQKQIRERYNNVINPNINKKPFTHQEKQLIMLKAYQLKKNWAGISKLMPGRTDNKIKNCYNSIVKKIAKKIHFDKANPKQEQLILEYIQQYNTYDPDELANQIDLDQKNQSLIKVEHVNENSNTSNNQHNISPFIPSLQTLPIIYGHYYQNLYQPQYIGYPIYFIQRAETRQF